MSGDDAMRFIVVFLLLLLGGTDIALADDWDDCKAEEPERSIRGCSAIIERGDETRHNLAVAYYNRGLAYRHKEQYDRAIKDYGRAIDLKPDFADAYVNRGIAYHYKEQYDRAIKDYGRAIDLKPDYAAAYMNRGTAYHLTNQKDRALGDFDRAIALQPNYAIALQKRIILLQELKQFDRALKDCDSLIAIYPKEGFSWLWRGRFFQYIGKYDLALKDLDQAIALDPDRRFRYLERSEVNLQLGQRGQALSDFRKYQSLLKAKGDAKSGETEEREKKLIAALGLETGDPANAGEKKTKETRTPKAIHTKGMNGSVYVEGVFTRVGKSNWNETNSENGKKVMKFKTARSDGSVIELHDASRNIYIRFDLASLTTKLRIGKKGDWSDFYEIAKIDY